MWGIYILEKQVYIKIHTLLERRRKLVDLEMSCHIWKGDKVSFSKIHTDTEDSCKKSEFKQYD